MYIQKINERSENLVGENGEILRRGEVMRITSFFVYCADNIMWAIRRGSERDNRSCQSTQKKLLKAEYK